MFALIATIGMLACQVAVLPPDRDEHLRRGLLRALGAALGLLTAASLGTLLSRTLELNGGQWSALPGDMRLALQVTHFGHVWLRRLPALALLWLAWGWSLRRPRAPVAACLMLLALASIALTRSQTGHPADHGDWTRAVWIDWVHIVAAGAWLGSVFAMSSTVFPRLLRAGSAALGPSAQIFQRLSTLSGLALALLVAAGLYNASARLGHFAALWSTRYGAILAVKLALVLVMVALGTHNRYVKLPRLLHAAGLSAKAAPRRTVTRQAGGDDAVNIVRACARAVLLESLLGLGVIAATAVLLQAMPPADMPHARGAPRPSALSLPRGPPHACCPTPHGRMAAMPRSSLRPHAAQAS